MTGLRRLYLMVFFLFICKYRGVADGRVLQTIRELIQNNVAGEPIVHKETVWNFDPEIAEKRRELFYEQHGFRAANFIERIGVGVDGKEDVRRAAQAIRDEGRLNGEHNKNFP